MAPRLTPAPIGGPPVDERHTAPVLDALDARSWATSPVRGLDRVVTVRPHGTALALGRGRGTAHGAPDALPLRTNTVDGVLLLLALHLVSDIDAVFAELRRVLRPAGTLLVVVPSVSARSLQDLRWRRALRPVHRGPWPHRSALDTVSWLLTAADFAVLGDDRVPFSLPLPDTEAADRAVTELPAAGLWPPALTSAHRTALQAALRERAGPGRRLPVPLRRLVARR